MIALLWDIDGTLLTTGRAGIHAWETAVAAVCGLDVDLDGFRTAGQTDWNIAVDLLGHVGHTADDATAERLLRSYEHDLPRSLHTRQGSVLPGVGPVLDALPAMPEVVSVLLTGNTPGGARAKLAHYGLSHHFDGGGFCEGPGPRSDIARRAVDLATARAGSAGIDAAFVIGDTPHDIECGKAVGARTVAVATGVYGATELAGHAPWAVLEQLPAPGRFAELLGLVPAASR